MSEQKQTSGPLQACGDGKCSCKAISGEHGPIAEVISGKWGDKVPVIKVVGTPGSCTGELTLKAEMEVFAYGEIPEEVAVANTQRFVACWNACQGISTEALEDGVIQELVETLSEIIELGDSGYSNEFIGQNVYGHQLNAMGVARGKARGILAKLQIPKGLKEGESNE